jgi:hypothetical protein
MPDLPEPTRCHSYTYSDDKAEYTGHLHLYERNGTLWLTDLWVKAEKRGEGRATALLRAALADWGHRVIYLEVVPYTDKPRNVEELTALYGRYGFRPTDVPGVLYRPADAPLCVACERLRQEALSER